MDRPPILNSNFTNFCIYGLGITGQSVINYFDRKNFKEYKVWDDNKKKQEDEELDRLLGLTKAPEPEPEPGAEPAEDGAEPPDDAKLSAAQKKKIHMV